MHDGQASIASAELNLLSALIGADKPKEDNFKINLFPDPTPRCCTTEYGGTHCYGAALCAGPRCPWVALA